MHPKLSGRTEDRKEANRRSAVAVDLTAEARVEERGD